MRIAHLFLGAAALSLIAATASAATETPAACIAPAGIIAGDQKIIGDSNGLKAAEDMHLTDATEVLAFAKLIQALGAPDSVLTSDEIMVVKFTDAQGAVAAKEHVVFFVKGCKIDAGFVGTSMLKSMLRGA